MTTPMLEVRELAIDMNLHGGKRTIVSNVSLTIARGEVVGLIGESGSGKSMTARAIVANLPNGARATGSVLFDGVEVLSRTGSRLRTYLREDVAMVFQDARAHINPVRTVGAFLTERLRADGVRRIDAEKRAIKLLDDVRVAGAASVMRRYPHELSGGMLQRVMIAGAMAASPKLLIADEPTTALDVTTQSEVMAILDEMRAASGMGMLFITHDLELASAVCDRISVAYAGRIIESQDAARLTDSPLHPYTSALLGAQPRLHGGPERLEALPGSAVSAWEAPTGCSFAPRCAHAAAICREADPELRELCGAAVACWRVEDIRAVPDDRQETRDA